MTLCMHLCSDTANKCRPTVKFGSAIGKLYIYILLLKFHTPRCNQILVYYCSFPLQKMSWGVCLTGFASGDCSYLNSASVNCFTVFCLWPHPALVFHTFNLRCALLTLMICLSNVHFNFKLKQIDGTIPLLFCLC